MKKISGLESALCEIVNGSLYHLSLREIASVLKAEYGIKASHETVRKWVKKLHLDRVQTIEVHHKILRNKNTNVIEIAKGIMYYLQDTPELVCSYLKFILKEQYGIELSASTVYLLVRDLRATGGYDSVQKDDFVFTLQQAQSIVKSLDTSLACFDSEVVNGCIRIYAVSTLDSAVCPYCGAISNRLLHSRKREIMDVPFAGRPVKILLNTRQFHCCNADCSVKSFTERFSFLVPYSFKSNRLLSKM